MEREPLGGGIKPTIVKSAILATLWLVPFLLLFLAVRYGWHAVWTAVGVPADALPFADLRSITGAVVTLQKHGDPLVANPADPWNRAMNYPRIWVYLFSVLGINDQKVFVAGIAFCVLYLGCVSALILRCRRALDAAILLVAGLSLTPLWGMELGNTDLLIFFLVFLGSSVAATALQLGAFCAASLLKIYPLAAMAGNAMRQPAKLKVASVVLVAAVLGSFAWQWRDMKAIRNSTPVSNRMAYGTLAMKAQLEEEWGAQGAYAVDVGWSIWLACSLAGTAAIAAAYKSRSQFDETLQNSANGKVFSVFGAIYVFSFAIGSNWDYRLIFLLPTLPFMLEMIRNRAHRRWAVAYVAAVMVAENPLDLRSIHGTAVSHLATFFLFLMVLAVLTQQYKALLQERENWGLGKATGVRAGAERPSWGVRAARGARAGHKSHACVALGLQGQWRELYRPHDRREGRPRGRPVTLTRRAGARGFSTSGKAGLRV